VLTAASNITTTHFINDLQKVTLDARQPEAQQVPPLMQFTPEKESK
jgi:hypothetical protein